MSPKIRRVLVFAIPIALVIVGGTVWYVKCKIHARFDSSISKPMKAAADELVAAGIGNTFVNEPWFTKTDLHALSFYSVDERGLRVILPNESSERFFAVTSPKFMREAGFKTISEQTEMCPLVASTRASNTLVLASDHNLYLFDPTYGCFYNIRNYLEPLDAAMEDLDYNYFSNQIPLQ
jgi:hypothetical protein